MLKALAGACVLTGCLICVSIPAAAQEVVHALSGTVSAINPADNTITVFQDDGTRGVFLDKVAKKNFSLDKRIAAETTQAESFNKQGAYVVVFYYGDADNHTVVALKNLGAGPFVSTTGTVKKFDSHHGLTLEDNTGKIQTFAINGETVAEGMLGAVEGSKFDPQKGDHVRVVSSNAGGTPTALFMTEM